MPALKLTWNNVLAAAVGAGPTGGSGSDAASRRPAEQVEQGLQAVLDVTAAAATRRHSGCCIAGCMAEISRYMKNSIKRRSLWA